MPLNFPFVKNGGGSSSIRVGSKDTMDNLRPDPSTKGRLFLVTTPGKELIYLDNGTEWVPFNHGFQKEIKEINETIDLAYVDISNLQNALQEEIERAMAEEKTLATKVTVLTTEINTVTTEANIIILSLNNEITRAQEAEMNLKKLIEVQVEDAKTANIHLEKKIDQHIISLNEETERAKNAEELLQTNINAEVERAKSTEETIKNEISNLQENLNEAYLNLKEEVEELKQRIEYIHSIRQYAYFTSGSSDQQIGHMGQEAISFNGPSLSSDGIELLPMKNDSIIIQNEGTYRFSFIIGVKSVGPALFGLVDEKNSVLYTAGTFGCSSLGMNYSPLCGDAILRIPTGGTVIQLKNINDHITTTIGNVPDINSSTPNTHAATFLIERIN